MHNYYYHDPKMIDLAKLREDAQARLDGKGPYRGAREESIIHFHARYTRASAADVAHTGSSLTPHPCDDQCTAYKLVDNG